MTSLIDRILILEKITVEKPEISKKEIDFIALCEELCDRYNLIQEDMRTVDFSYSGQNRPIHTNQTLITHTLENLLSNAFKYSKNENPRLEVIFGKDALVITVSDDGVGIPEEELENIFQPFYRTKNVHDIQGTGLGLSIVKEYVALSGGSIKVESRLNQGATFTITLQY
tara:strand:- start:42 stop:551 length:510 start_codon:yes stop_codon:yes gene_type:complete